MKRETFFTMRGPQDLDGLQDLIKYINTYSNTQEMTMIEIGSYVGESTTLFAKNFKKVISIDPYMNDYDLSDPAVIYHPDFEVSVYNEFQKNIRGIENIESIRLTSDEGVSKIKTLVDFVYIDGLHTYDQCLKDIKNYQPLILPGGFIGGHDYHQNWPGVVQAITESFTIDSFFGDTSWIKRI